MTWALKRQTFYLVVLILFLSIFGYLILNPYLQKVPSCTDGVKNGTETGIDCGGSCARACTSDSAPVSILWSRVFKVVDRRYNAVAYLENHNSNLAVNKIKYRFRFADANNIYIGKREGETFIPPATKFAVFEPAIDIGNSIPVYTTFEWSEVPVWVKVPEDVLSELKVFVSNVTLTNEDTSPAVSAVVKNNSLFTIPDVNMVAILYNAGGNAIAASRTYINQLNPEESREVNFTWPEIFADKVTEKEVIPFYNVFSAKLK